MKIRRTHLRWKEKLDFLFTIKIIHTETVNRKTRNIKNYAVMFSLRNKYRKNKMTCNDRLQKHFRDKMAGKKEINDDIKSSLLFLPPKPLW